MLKDGSLSEGNIPHNGNHMEKVALHVNVVRKHQSEKGRPVVAVHLDVRAYVQNFPIDRHIVRPTVQVGIAMLSRTASTP